MIPPPKKSLRMDVRQHMHYPVDTFQFNYSTFEKTGTLAVSPPTTQKLRIRVVTCVKWRNGRISLSRSEKHMN